MRIYKNQNHTIDSGLYRKAGGLAGITCSEKNTVREHEVQLNHDGGRSYGGQDEHNR